MEVERMGRRENIAMIETLREEYSSQFIELGQRKWVKFSTRREMVEFVAIYFTKEYCASLVMQRPTRKEKEKMEIWNQKVEAISSVFEATKEAIYLKCNKFCCSLTSRYHCSSCSFYYL